MLSRMLPRLGNCWITSLFVSVLLTLGILLAGVFAEQAASQPAESQPSAREQEPESPADPTQPQSPPPNIEQIIRFKGPDRVDIHVAEVPLSSVLRILSSQGRKNIVASPQVRGTVTADLFDVSFDEALDSILRMNNCGFEERGRFIYVYTLQEMADMATSKTVAEPLVAKLIRLNYVSVKDVQALIQPLLSKEGKVAATPDAKTGLEADAKDAGGNSLSGPDLLMIYDVASRVEQIEKVIRDVDVRPRQVLIEATILRAALNEDNALGIDFNIVTGVDFEMLASTSPGVTDLNTGDVPQAQLNNTNSTIRTDFNSAVPTGGLTFGIIKDQVAFFLRALEQVSDTTVLANPKVLALNKQQGMVMVGRRDGYLTTTVTETTAVQTVEFLETGTRLVFRPFIGDDGFVRMEIHPEDSSGSLNESNLPFETTTEVTSNILVRDGYTILIGGLFRESTNTIRGQVPIVGNIPGIGALFRATDDQTEREEVIILLTVHVVKDEGKYAELGDELAEEVMEMRIGARRGLQWFGRNRIALAHYHTALQHMKAGRRDKALWDVRMSLHVSPTYLPAIKLKDKLTGRHSCDYTVGQIRDLIRRRIVGKTGAEDIGPPLPGEPALKPLGYDAPEAADGRSVDGASEVASSDEGREGRE
ncbi:MAG: hypothetical protein JXQ73_33525 [Phycisphaerae bacterium]|nr:hypothetical protein [Phycisphaerae bacterium]